jgi:hypothetical protein
MTPLPNDPTVVVYINEQREVIAFASNIAYDLRVVAVRNKDQWNDKRAGKPFVSAPDYDDED